MHLVIERQANWCFGLGLGLPEVCDIFGAVCDPTMLLSFGPVNPYMRAVCRWLCRMRWQARFTLGCSMCRHITVGVVGRLPAWSNTATPNMAATCRPVPELSDGVVLGQLAPGMYTDRIFSLLSDALTNKDGARQEAALKELEVRVHWRWLPMAVYSQPASCCRCEPGFGGICHP